MALKISEISIEGFRGFNDKVSLSLGDGVTLLYGKNGEGKSSLFQSIEWCLTGELPYFVGQDFTREDAIVNEFTTKKLGTVTLTLVDLKKKIILTRTRKLGKSSTRGSSSLSVELDGKNTKDDEAQLELEKRLGLGSNDFSRIFYLHQESIRDLLTEDQKERSRGIDRLLGIYEAREFAEALDVDRYFKRQQNLLEERMNQVGADKANLAKSLRQLLSEKKKKLLSSGSEESDLTTDACSQQLSTLVTDSEIIGKKYNPEARKLDHPLPSIGGLISCSQQLGSYLRDLDQWRIKSSNTLEKSAGALLQQRNLFAECVSEIDSIADKSLESVESSIRKISNQLEQVEPKLRDFDRLVTGLSAFRSEVTITRKNISDFNLQIQQIQSSYGDLEKIKSQYDEENKKINEIRKSIESSSSLGQLLVAGQNYLNMEHPNNCPICEQPIELARVIKSLDQRSKTDLAQKIRSLDSDLKQKLRFTSDLKSSIDNLERINGNLTAEKSRLGESLSKLQILLDAQVTDDYPFDTEIDKINSASQEIREQTVTLSKEKLTLEQEYSMLRKLLTSLESAQQKLQTLLKSKAVGQDLTKIADEKIAELNKRAQEYNEDSSVEDLFYRSSKINETIEYLKDEEELTNLEKELPNIAKLLESLNEKKVELEKLQTLIGSFRDVALEYEKDAAKTELNNLAEQIDSYYTKLVGHPIFKKIRIVPEKGETPIYSLQAVGTQGSTYLQTRLSNAQMNSAAIALFLANNEKLAQNFGTVLMDDPTQSMDTEHKEALSKLISELSKTRQVIVSTEDREFYDIIVKYCKTAKIYSFDGWTTKGPKVAIPK